MRYLFAALVAIVLCVEARGVDVAEFGAIPNDDQDDSAAIQGAIDAELGEVTFPPGVLKIHSQVILRSGSKLTGYGTTLQTNGAVPDAVLLIEEGANDVTIAGLKLETPLCHTAIKNAGKASNLTIRDMELSGSIPHTNFLVALDGQVEDVHIERVRAHTALTCILLRDAINRATLRDVTVTNWRTYGILLRVTANGPHNTSIDSFFASNPAPGKLAAARQMIAAYADPDQLKAGLAVGGTNFQLTNSRCIGPYEPWDKESETSAGTADQIALHYLRGFTIRDVVTVGGGENNCTVALCSNGTISNLYSAGADGHGIQIGSADFPSREIDLSGGFIGRNGLRRDPRARDSMASVYFQNATHCSVNGVLIVDDSPRHQAYGINVSESTDISLGRNQISCKDPDFKPVVVFASTLAELPTERLGKRRKPKVMKVSDADSLLAAVRNAKPLDQIELANEIRVAETLTVSANDISINGGAIRSTASPIIKVDADRFSLADSKIYGTSEGTPEHPQIGIYSAAGRNGILRYVWISGTSIGVKLERLRGEDRNFVEVGADFWTFDDCSFTIIGTLDGSGYGILAGTTHGHRVLHSRGHGKPGWMRHFFYISGGASDCLADGSIISNCNSSSIALYSIVGQPPCRNNIILNNVITGQRVGEEGTGGIEITGQCVGTKILSNKISDVATTGILVNSHGLVSESDTTIEKNELRRIGLDGIRLQGTVVVRVIENLIEDVSQSMPGARACISMVAWYQSTKRVAASKIDILGNKLNWRGAREPITKNATPPKPSRIVEENNTIEM